MPYTKKTVRYARVVASGHARKGGMTKAAAKRIISEDPVGTKPAVKKGRKKR